MSTFDGLLFATYIHGNMVTRSFDYIHLTCCFGWFVPFPV